jgi:hypothetical protein
MRWSVTLPLREVVGADALGAIAATDQTLARRRLGSLLLAQLHIMDARREHRHCLGTVAMLGAIVLAFDHDAGGQMGDAHRRIGLVDVLPPAGLARKVSIPQSAGLIATASSSSASGITATVQAEVWMRPWVSVTGMRCTRWPPDSNLSFE